MGRNERIRYAILPCAGKRATHKPPEPLVTQLHRRLQANHAPEAILDGIRASSLFVRLGRLLQLDDEQLDRGHLCSLARFDLASNRLEWIESGYPNFANIPDALGQSQVSTLVEWSLVVASTVREHGVFHGYEQLSRLRSREDHLMALWDIRFDSSYWLRILQAPLLESLLTAGRTGLSPADDKTLPCLPFLEFLQKAA